MRVSLPAPCPQPSCGGAIALVVDDGRERGASDGESMRSMAMDIIDRHGGWKCDRCDYRMGLSTELLDAIAGATA